MTRLALAKTLVSGTVTLQGIPYSFTASASGTATADRVPQAKKAATVASNAAAVIAARASIDKILADNSAILSDLEITSLISNNFTTTVRVFKPILFETFAETTDGINYFTNKETTIKRGQWLTVPNGKTLTFNAPGKNYGYFQIGEGPNSLSSSNQKNLKATQAKASYTSNYQNYGVVVVASAGETGGEGGTTCDIKAYFVNSAEYSEFINLGTTTIYTGWSINNNAQYANVTNGGGTNSPYDAYLYIQSGTDTGIFNSQNTTYLYNTTYGYISNSGYIENNGEYSYVSNYGFVDNEYGTVTCTGSGSYTENAGTDYGWKGEMCS